MTEWDSSAWLSWTRSCVWLIRENGSAHAQAGSRRRFVNARILKHPVADCQSVPQTRESDQAVTNSEERNCAVGWDGRKRSPRTESRFWVFPYWHAEGRLRAQIPSPCQEESSVGIMRGLTGLIITTCRFKRKNTGWMEKKEMSDQDPQRSRFWTAFSVLGRLLVVPRGQTGAARAHVHADTRLHHALLVPLQTFRSKNIHDSHHRVSRNWTLGRQNGSEKSLTARPVRTLRRSLDGRLQVTWGSACLDIWLSRWALRLHKLPSEG